MDIVVTTPADRVKEAAQEATDCLRNGGGYYFRVFSPRHQPDVAKDDRVFYVERGCVRGFALVEGMKSADETICATTGRNWRSGRRILMRADSWKWIKPIPMRGFQGYRYAHKQPWFAKIEIIGGWRDPMPEVE